MSNSVLINIFIIFLVQSQKSLFCGSGFRLKRKKKLNKTEEIRQVFSKSFERRFNFKIKIYFPRCILYYGYGFVCVRYNRRDFHWVINSHNYINDEIELKWTVRFVLILICTRISKEILMNHSLNLCGVGKIVNRKMG